MTGHDFARCEAASLFVKTSLQLSGFLPNDSKSIWQPTSCLVWLGYCVDLAVHTISIPSVRILSFVGKVISMGFVFGNITRIMTRYSHFDILRSPTWDEKISLSGSTLKKLCFRKENIPSLNSRRLSSTQFHYSRIFTTPFLTSCGVLMRRRRAPLTGNLRPFPWV
ncbi:unnamed protein product [Porites lobata]|uniref:Uncharacterized protein n=1 Tax=Porites lobata TaxID=104759 RepID=A0ABN8R096_9CNID|nr:unnamed protein product [Porites lobata]